jgi:hypothetical protein
MKHTDSLAKLAPALVAAQAELKAVGKDSTNPHFKNRYASLDTIIESVRPTLSKHGLAIVQGATVPMTTDSGGLVGFAVETMLVHASGEWLTNTAIIPLSKADAQGAGGALTYGRRYSLAALLSLATEEDDDGNAASRPAVAAQRASAPAATNGASAANGDRGSHAKPMPFGKFKGTPLGELDTSELDRTVTWAKKTDAEKFKDLIAACDDVLRDRMESEMGASV